jgi:hypothetical protein
VLDEHLAGDLVLPPLRDREVDLEERVRVAVEHRRHVVLLEQRHVLEPVDVLSRRRGDEVDVLDERQVLLVREAVAGQELGIESPLLLGFVAGHQSPASASSAGWSGR